MTIDIGPNLVQLAHLVVALLAIYLLSDGWAAVGEAWIKGRHAVKRARIRSDAEIIMARDEANPGWQDAALKRAKLKDGPQDPPGGAQ